ncbi:MAG: serine hydrolase, partial [Thermoflexibacter sp.]|nr:serine hydrolase [Thermoflexibacter sp.]
MKKIIQAISLWLLISLNSYSQSINFVRDSIDIYVAEAMRLWQIPAMAVAVVKDGKVIFSKGYGTREIGKTAKVDENTLFMIASNSKAFTATALCMLEYSKKLSIDDKVIKYFPDFKLFNNFITQEVTIRDLLCHRVGLKTFQGDFAYWGSNLSRKQVMERFGKNKPIYDFRTRYGYCNAGFLTAGEIIPMVTNRQWEEFVRDSLVKPLKMSRTLMLAAEIPQSDNVAVPHTIFDDKLIKIPYPQIDALAPAGSMVSSVKDVANWLIMQLDTGRFEGKQIVSKQAIMKTWTANTIVSPNKSSFYRRQFSLYGLGWGIQDYAGKRLLEHTGGADGFVTSTCFLPEEKLGVIVLTNTDQNTAYLSLRYQIVDAFLKQPYRNYNKAFFDSDAEGMKEEAERIKTERAKVAQKNKPTLPMNDYVGVYEQAVYGQMEIKLEKDQLIAYFSNHPHLVGKLEAQGGNN